MKLKAMRVQVATPKSEVPNAFRRWCGAALAAVAIVASRAASEEPFESPQIVRAETVLSRAQRSGPLFKVAPRVEFDGYLYHFSVSSKYGSFAPIGIPALEELIRELKVLEELQQFTETRTFTDAAQAAGVALIAAPFKVVGKVAEAVANPSETAKKIKNVPSGLSNLFDFVKEKTVAGAERVSRAISGSPEGSKEGPSALDVGSEALGKGSELALDYIGYSARENAWYEKYGIDPYTANQPLKNKIRTIAAVEVGVHIGFKFMPGIGSLGVLSTANDYLQKAEKLSLYSDPKELQDKGDVALEEIGFSKEERARFAANSAYTPTTRAMTIFALKSLRSVKNRRILFPALVRVQNRQGAEFMRDSLLWLSRSPASDTPTEFLDNFRFPVARTRSGRVFVPFPIDRLIWSEGNAQTAHYLRERAERAQVLMHVRGTVSSRAAQELGGVLITALSGIDFRAK